MKESHHINQRFTALMEELFLAGEACCLYSKSSTHTVMTHYDWLITTCCHEPRQSPTSTCTPCQGAKQFLHTHSGSVCNSISDSVMQHRPQCSFSLPSIIHSGKRMETQRAEWSRGCEGKGMLRVYRRVNILLRKHLWNLCYSWICLYFICLSQNKNHTAHDCLLM